MSFATSTSSDDGAKIVSRHHGEELTLMNVRSPPEDGGSGTSNIDNVFEEWNPNTR